MLRQLSLLALLFSSTPFEDEVLINWHRSIDVGGPVERVFRPHNGVPGNTQSVEFTAGLQELREIVDRARLDNKRLKACGSKWSLSNVLYQQEYMVESGGLNFLQIGFEDENETLIDPNYQDKKDMLVFAQAGVMMTHLTLDLYEKGLSLSVTGEGNGQRLVGSISTGAHGSSYTYGATQDMVRGIHLVLPNEDVYIQKSSNKAVTQPFVTEWLGATRLIEDDDMFNAVVVSFGSFGIIHGVLIEAEPLFAVEVESKRWSFSTVRPLLLTSDVSQLGYQSYQAGELPFRTAFVFNPYRTGDSEDGFTVRTMRKIPPIGEREEPNLLPFAGGFVSVIQTIGVYIGRILFNIFGIERFFVGELVQTTLDYLFPVIDYTQRYAFDVLLYYGATEPMGDAIIPGMNAEFAVPMDRVPEALDLLLSTLDETLLPAGCGIRYVKSSEATLAMNRFGPVTAFFDVTGVWGDWIFTGAEVKLEQLFRALEESDIPHVYHWGKKHPQSSEWVFRGHGMEAVAKWKAQRALLLDQDGRDMFASDWSEAVGLH